MTNQAPPGKLVDPASPEGELAFAAEIAGMLRSQIGRSAMLSQLLPRFVDLLGLGCAGLVTQHQGGWQVESWSDVNSSSNGLPAAKTLPNELISDAIDRGTSRTDGRWWAVPCQVDVNEDGVIVSSPLVGCLVFQADDPAAAADRINRVSQLLVTAIIRTELDSRHRHRIAQLTSVLESAARWQQTQLLETSDDNTLLRQIADSATDLIDCERASIFLWDKRRNKLIGRPALGIDDRPLVIPDDAGIVGEVLATKEPQIWNGNSDDESRINREIDRTLEFDTRSLVAVPLIGTRGETIGVFEAINHRENQFDTSHVLLLSDLATHAAVAIQAQRAKKTLTESRDRLVRDAASSTPMIGQHPSVVAVRDSGTKVAKTDLSVLILGENGTGKEVVAKHIHYESDRKNGPFVAVNCAALVESLLESELFGHEKGSFTDANATRVGKFELAGGGTLFLDEVGDMSPGGQAKLLRVLEQKEVVRVGGSVPIPVDVRVIAATNQPLEQLIAQKRFREDLFFRLNVVSLTLPGLADRGRDVLLLADHFLHHFCYEIGRKVPVFSDAAQSAMLSHPWPGNVRELRNTIERVSYLTAGDQINAADLELRSPLGEDGHAGSNGSSRSSLRIDLPTSLAESTRLFQIDHICQAIENCSGNMTEAASRLDLHRSNLYRKMKQLGMRTGEEES
ncbi:sigma-54-dependent Fis family transcriptional regulator [Stieleria sp. TO1_6]|uniref:sigma-54 interaction domain-containing protein n=1 Tax=Stieleria tagensis TaxID=2956795 RepID=UPI00209AD8E8|nr:sigma-54-dependent Fis family transcriptional regulator [Stieleria tagensis]MCO8123249.1 sigma-54-dependent Fis family transcriptional regulator [Stieleria tagensis]